MEAEPNNNQFGTNKKYMLKVPIQKRSKETVSNIIRACTNMLTTMAYHEITTDKISEVAQVSIGSLYQFFPNKEAIISAVIDDLLSSDIAYLQNGLSQLPQTDISTKISSMIDLGVSLFHTNRELRSVLQNAQGFLDYWDARRIFFDTYKKIIIQHLPEIPNRDQELVGLILVSTFSNSINIFCLSEPHTSEKINAFKAELFILISRYLQS